MIVEGKLKLHLIYKGNVISRGPNNLLSKADCHLLFQMDLPTRFITFYHDCLKYHKERHLTTAIVETPTPECCLRP